MNKDELIELILLNIERLGIVMAPTKLEQFAIINCEKFIGVYDPSSVTPFILAHEFIHAKYSDKLRHCENDILSLEEKRANKESIILLWEMYKEQGGNASYFSNFIDIAGCPFEESITVLRESEINEAFYDRALQPFKGDIRKCAIDYISQFDVIEIIKVYDFLEAYNFSYDLYDEAIKEFQELSDQQDIAY
ncbi:hypothetical protein [Lactococcus lactis]|uniref:hypothetical protein n=1 Tax=Lactococcus lactis TaxID=1358 RepID=UPI00071CBE9F|nr:hypothetical protein [Lactococcus lactis]KST78796.1 Phage protein [Lactococcus lactis subsp. lactis]MCT0449873.1 hypothetical protein [Lactococcus lactis subsp. lactis]MCT1192008.1 hypothetical protein [Lactococcus lactis]MDG4986587.1 hypothetical protein [Lactococcus lactis]